MKIGNISLKNNLLLAPIAGYTDAGFRALCLRFGAGLAYTEMVSAKALTYGNQNTKALLYTTDIETIKAVQIFGCEPEIIAKAIKLPELKKFDIIDINMGCPMPKLVKNNEGAALMQNETLVYNIIKQAKAAADGRAVTAKIRAGFNQNEINAPKIAKIIEDAGGDLVTIHGRTRDMYYAGKACLNTIASVKAAVKIPVVGNGDVTDSVSLNAMLSTGVNGVMIARGALGKPYIFSMLSAQCSMLNGGINLNNLIKEHYQILLQYLPEKTVLNDMKKHLVFYLKGIKDNKLLREKIYKALTVNEVFAVLGFL
jgi:nifR3 family TIM-barrel protein